MKPLKVPNFKGYVDVPPKVFSEIERQPRYISHLLKVYKPSMTKPSWINDLLNGAGAAAFSYKGYIFIRHDAKSDSLNNGEAGNENDR